MPAYLFRVGMDLVIANRAGRIGIYRISKPAIQIILCAISIAEDSLIARTR
jgi:hypothetical protein